MSSSSFLQKDTPTAKKRNVKDVPFVELFHGRVQGVVSSGSDIERVYVAFFEAGTLEFYCSTNNNRPCGGLSARPCKHLSWLLEEAVEEYGAEQVARFLKIPGDISQITTWHDIMVRVTGSVKKDPASDVFSRFLMYLRYLELQPSNQPIPEMAWFIS